jgi:transcriptional regulator with XRE-family HTH domain
MPRSAKQSAADKAIGARLRAYRQASGLSQSDVGQKIGVTFQQIQKYEKGSNRLSGSRLIEVAHLFKVEPAKLLGVNGGGPSNEEFEALSDPGVTKMILAMKHLTKQRRSAVAAAVVDLIRAFGAKA